MLINQDLGSLTVVSLVKSLVVLGAGQAFSQTSRRPGCRLSFLGSSTRPSLAAVVHTHDHETTPTFLGSASQLGSWVVSRLSDPQTGLIPAEHLSTEMNQVRPRQPM